MFDDVKKTVTTAIETRLNNQIIGTFSISWCLFNWKAIATVSFPSSISLTDRFMALEKLGYVGLHPYDHMLAYPALSTLLILFAIPYFSLRLVSWETWIQNKKNLIRKKLIEVIPIDEHEEKLGRLNKQLHELRQEAGNKDAVLESRDATIRKLEEDIAALKGREDGFTMKRLEFEAMTAEKEEYVQKITEELEALKLEKGNIAKQVESQSAQATSAEKLETPNNLLPTDPNNHDTKLVTTLQELGDQYKKSGKEKEASSAFKAALYIPHSFAKDNPEAYKSHLAQTLQLLAGIYRETGRMDKAEEALEKALVIQQQQNSLPQIAQSLQLLSDIYRQTGRMDKAEEALEKALVIQQQQNSLPQIAQSLQLLSDIYRQTGRMDKAEHALEKALAIQQQLGSS